MDEADLKTLVRAFRASVVEEQAALHRRMGELSIEVRQRFTTAETALLNELRGLSERTDTRFTHLEHELADIKQDVAAVQRQVAGLEQEVAGIKQEVVGIKQEVTGLRQDVAALAGGLHVLTQSVEELLGR